MKAPGVQYAGFGTGTETRNISRSFSFFFLFLFFALSSAWGLDPSRHISQYGHTAWRIQDGSFAGAPHAIAQTRDGYLWIGTEAGLVRFDGVRFSPWTEPGGKHLPSPAIYSLLGGADGSLWIGTGRALAHWTKGDLVNYPEAIGRINSILEDREGAVWTVLSRLGDRTKGPLCRIAGKDVRCYGERDGITCPNADALARDGEGNFWVGSSDALCRWKPDSSSTYLRDQLKQTGGLAGIAALAIRGGDLWAGIARSGRGLGLQKFMDGVWKGYVTPGLDGTTLDVSALLVDRDNTLWIGTMDQGIYRVHDGKADHFRVSDGLSSDSVENFFQDREGNMWAVTSKGIDCFRDVRVSSFSVREGLTADRVNSVLATRDGTVWVGNQGGLDFLRNDTLSSITAQDGMPGRNVTSLFEDHAGRLFVGIDGGLTIFQGGHFRAIRKLDGAPLGIVVAMTEDMNHNVWAQVQGRPAYLARIRDLRVKEEVLSPPTQVAFALAADPQGGILLGLVNGNLARYWDGQFHTFSANHGAEAGPVLSLLTDSDGSVWGATKQGLVRWNEGKAETLNSSKGLPCDSVFSLLRDNAGSVWLATACGLMVISNDELGKWAKQPEVAVEVKTFDIFDGAQPARSSFQPKASLAPDGRIWFANDSILQVIDPSHLNANAIPPPVHIEKIVADRISYPSEQESSLPPLTRDLEIDYTALSFVVPQKVRFRYKLEGHDADWQEPGTRRQAFYNDLGPGRYRFRVIACNNDAIWNEDGATLDFSVAPAWFQTNWFRVLCVALVICITWVLYRLRVRRIASALGARFNERLAERTRMARELHDTFLQTLQGSKLVAEDALEKSSDPVQMRSAMEKLSVWLEQGVQEGRAALNSLRTSTTQTNDLAEAFKRAAEETRMQSPMEVSFSVTGDSREIHPVVRDEIYRIGYEAIRNAYTHSKGNRLEVGLRYGKDLSVRVSDNGIAIDPAVTVQGKDGHFGLKGMRERAARIGGKLTIVSSADSGTVVTVVVPGGIVFRKPSPGPLEKIRSIFRRVGPTSHSE